MSKEKLSQLLGTRDVVAIQLGTEKNVEELWNASHADKYKIRDISKWKYPVDDWFGLIVNDNGIPKLVSNIGYSLQDGKNNQKFAFVGGAKTHPDFTGKGYMRMVREKALSQLEGITKVAGFTALRKKKGFKNLEKPDTHDVVPDEIIEFMKERVNNIPEVEDWGIYKRWQMILKKNY